MKIRMIDREDKEKTIWVPTGFLFSKLGIYLISGAITRRARREYDQAISSRFRDGDDIDDLITLDDVQAAERLDPPITEEQARELLTTLRDSKYLLGGLPLVSIEETDGRRIRIDL